MQLGSRRPVVYDIPGFPRNGVLDNFNRADGLIGANWTGGVWTVAGPTLSVSSQQVKADTTPNAQYYWNAGTFGPNSEVFVDIPVNSTANILIFVRMTTPGTNGAGYTIGTNGPRIFRIDSGGSFTQLGASFGVSFANGDAVGLTAVGSTLTAYRKPSGDVWASLGQRTDTTYTGAGYLALELDDLTFRADNFGGGTI